MAYARLVNLDGTAKGPLHIFTYTPAMFVKDGVEQVIYTGT